MTGPRRAPLAIAVGDPAGIGPEVAVRAALERAAGEALALFGDAAQLADLLARYGWMGGVRSVDPDALEPTAAGSVLLCDVGRTAQEVIDAREPTAEGGQAQLRALELAARATIAGHARALVTGPVSKLAVELGGTSFRGQTEHLALLASVARDAVTMMFLGPRLRVALVTTHLPLRDVPAAVTELRVARTIVHLGEALVRIRSMRAAPDIGVAGLNPHAGERGLLGQEELHVVVDGIARARRSEPFASSSATVQGPLPAEAALRAAADGRFDGVVAMYHDQATIASKLLDWGSAVNVSWGLPFVRTSVDHGVAYDIAGRGTATHEGMLAAIDLAARLTLGDGGRR